MLATGQTTSYFPGDDGDIQAGVPIVFALLTTGQYSGSTNIVVNGKTEVIANTVAVNQHTGKMWTRERPDSGIGPASNGLLFWTDATNNETIFEYADQANIALLSGHNDWRVPNLTEALVLHEAEGVSPFLDEVAFYNMAFSPACWTSTTDPLNPASNAFIVQYSSVTYNGKGKTTTGPALLVRDV